MVSMVILFYIKEGWRDVWNRIPYRGYTLLSWTFDYLNSLVINFKIFIEIA